MLQLLVESEDELGERQALSRVSSRVHGVDEERWKEVGWSWAFNSKVPKDRRGQPAKESECVSGRGSCRLPAIAYYLYFRARLVRRPTPQALDGFTRFLQRLNGIVEGFPITLSFFGNPKLEFS